MFFCRFKKLDFYADYSSVLNIFVAVKTGCEMIILSSIVAFTIIILLLVFMLLFAQKKLVQSGPVKIMINGEKTLTVSAGSSLLSTLANEKIFLPSACGGGGTCAMCKCVVESGGGDVLPTELGHLTRQEKKEQRAPWLPGESKTGSEHSDSR